MSTALTVSHIAGGHVVDGTAAIRYAHKFAGLASPTDDELVKATVRGIRRTLGTAKIKKAPATAERLLAMAANTYERLARVAGIVANDQCAGEISQVSDLRAD